MTTMEDDFFVDVEEDSASSCNFDSDLLDSVIELDVLPDKSKLCKVDFVGTQNAMEPMHKGETDLINYLGGGKFTLDEVTLTPPTVTQPACSGPSSPDSSKFDKFPELCMSKNAIAARENRKKKKQYTVQLENELAKLKTENEALKKNKELVSVTVKELQSEVEYLKGVIANQSTLSKLLGNIHQTNGVKFYTSFSMQNSENNNKENEKDKNDNSKKKIVNDNDNCSRKRKLPNQPDIDSTRNESNRETRSSKKKFPGMTLSHGKPSGLISAKTVEATLSALKMKNYNRDTCIPV